MIKKVMLGYNILIIYAKIIVFRYIFLTTLVVFC